MSDVIAELRQALAEFDRCGTTDRSGRVERARRVLTLVRELLSEVDAERQPEGASVSRTPEVDGAGEPAETPRVNVMGPGGFYYPPCPVCGRPETWEHAEQEHGTEPLGPPDPAHGELPGDETHAFAPGSGPLPDSDPEACDVCGEGGGHWRHNVPDPSLD